MEIERLGKYEVRGTLGKGAMGTVYEAWDPIISRKVAIKTVRRPDASDLEAQEELERFKREAQAAGRLTHPNIVGIFDYGETEELAYIVMEFVDGRTLKALLDNGERMPVAIVGRVMADMLAGLNYSHERGVIHRDIKPANIMITKEGHAKIADFGIARIESSNLTQAGTIMGTPAYMSPEQFMGQTVDVTTDIYSSGVLLFQLLTGERPFEGSMATIMHKVLNTVPPKPSELSVTAPVALDEVVTQAMAKRPEERFQTAAAFAEALRNALTAPAAPRTPSPPEADATIIASPTGRPTRPAAPAAPAREPAQAPAPVAAPPKRKSRTPMVAAGVVLAAALGGGGAWFALSGSANAPNADIKPVVISAAPSAASGSVTTVQPPSAPQSPSVAPAAASSPSAPTPAPNTVQVQNGPPAQPPVPPPQPNVTAVVPPAVTQTPASTSTPTAGPSTQPTVLAAGPKTQPAAIVRPSTAPPSTPIVAEAPRPVPATTAPSANTRLPAPTVAEAPQPPVPLVSPAAPLVASAAQPAPAPAAAAPVPSPTPAPTSSVPAAAAPVPVPTPATAAPPIVTAAAGLSPEALRRAVSSAVANADCAVVTGDVSPSNQQVELGGVVGRGQPEQNLQRAVRDVAPTATVDWGLGVLEGPYCPALNLIRAHVPAFGTGQPGVQVSLKSGQTNLSDGDKVEIRARAPNFSSYLEIDYFSNDGSVAHLIKASAGTPPVQPGITREMLVGEVAPPYGTDLIIAIASSAPLFTRDQPLPEEASAYLRELRTALDNATRRNTKVAAGVLMVHTSPRS